MCRVKAKSEVKVMIEVQAQVCPPSKNFLSQKTVGQPTVQKTVPSKPSVENRREKGTANRREGTVQSTVETTIQGTVGANRPSSRPYTYRGGMFVKS